MKLRIFLLLALLGGAVCGGMAQPAPRETHSRPGSFVFQPGTAISADEALQPLAQYAAEYLGYPVRREVTGDGAIVLTLEDTDSAADSLLSPESYTLEIAADHIRINAATSGGVFNSGRSASSSACCPRRSMPGRGSPWAR